MFPYSGRLWFFLVFLWVCFCVCLFLFVPMSLDFCLFLLGFSVSEFVTQFQRLSQDGLRLCVRLCGHVCLCVCVCLSSLWLVGEFLDWVSDSLCVSLCVSVCLCVSLCVLPPSLSLCVREGVVAVGEAARLGAHNTQAIKIFYICRNYRTLEIDLIDGNGGQSILEKWRSTESDKERGKTKYLN